MTRFAERPVLAPAVVERIRRERYAPRPTQCDYLHLRDLLAQLTVALRRVPRSSAPTLDLYCGTQPYRELLPSPAWGVDLDRHFGRTDVVATVPLPFADQTFGLALCSQALHLVDDPPATVAELERVLRADGMAIVTVPHLFRREIPAERRLSREALVELFAQWEVEITGFGGLGSALAFAPASLLHGIERRFPATAIITAAAGMLLTLIGMLVDGLTLPLRRTLPANWLIVARPPASRVSA